MNLFNLLTDDTCEIGRIKKDWLTILENDAQAAIKIFLQLLIDLSQYQYEIKDEELYQEEEIDSICDGIIRNADAAYVSLGVKLKNSR